MEEGEALLHGIRQASAKHRAAPLEFFKEYLQEIWMDNSPEEAEAQWRVKVEQYPWFADDALYCIKQILREPPKDLPALLQEYGWVSLYHETPNSMTPFTDAEVLAWLQQHHDHFNDIYQQAAK